MISFAYILEVQLFFYLGTGKYIVVSPLLPSTYVHGYYQILKGIFEVENVSTKTKLLHIFSIMIVRNP
jgi:hypothetical protein